jgi:hypothetical protein
MKPSIALFVADPMCSVQSANGVIKALGNNYNFKIFGKSEVEDTFFTGIDLIIVPGGFGDADSFDKLFKNNGDAVKEFVNNGGKYLGICMGAYWAGSYYFDLLDSADTVQYITRPNTDTRRPHAKDIKIVWNGHPSTMFFYDGCAIDGDPSKFTTVAKYSNGDPMAIIQGNVGVIGCHPESEKFWYDSYTWMQDKYQCNHSLLLDFVEQLMSQP